ncbi:hypothetical protein KQI52_06905 [bacterium]|nr:hypothetical protein [bacterium]
MNARHWLHRAGLVALLLPLALFTGCGGDGGSDTPDDSIDADRTLIVENADYPVWIDGDSFLFNYSDDSGTQGLFRSDLDGNVTEVYGEAKNDDYVVSPSGTWAAFSTPALDGGVVVVELSNPPGEPILLLQGGKRPDFIDDDTVVMENASGVIGWVDVADPGVFNTLVNGGWPVVNGDGTKIAFLTHPSGFNLNILTLATSDIVQVVTDVGSDYCWNPTADELFVSQLAANTLTQVLQINVTGESYSVFIAAGTRPSVSADGTHFFCDLLSGETLSGIQYINLETGREGEIRGTQVPAAAPSGTRLLTEQSQNIYLLEFE